MENIPPYSQHAEQSTKASNACFHNCACYYKDMGAGKGKTRRAKAVVAPAQLNSRYVLQDHGNVKKIYDAQAQRIVGVFSEEKLGRTVMNGAANARLMELQEAEASEHYSGPQNKRATFDTSKWYDFADGVKSGSVDLFEYYGPTITQRTPPYSQKFISQFFIDQSRKSIDHEKVTAELFKDAVATGAFTLPKGVSADDFEFGPILDPNPDHQMSYMGIASKSNSNAKVRVGDLSYDWVYEAPLSGVDIQEVLSNLSQSVNILLSR